jgi:arginine utilization regulatory protein
MDIENIKFIQELGNFVDTLIVVDENYRICYHKVFRQGGLAWEEASSIGKTPVELFSGFTREQCLTYRALRYNEVTVNKLVRVVYKDEEYAAVVNTFPVRQDGRTVGVVTTGQILDGDLARFTINVPEPVAIQEDRLYDVTDIIGDSPEMAQLRQKILRVAASGSSVFIYGETGTGKELVAQSLHVNCPGRAGRFISQNCAAIPQTLLESIFFGTSKGSFTGAQNKPGIFEMAKGGTVFLDEMNSMDLGMQAKLLRAIEEKTITRVGGSEPTRIDVRIISAINQSPDRCLQDKTIRSDLFYRMAQVQIRLPPLRERKADLPALAAHFIQKFNREMCTRVEGVSGPVLDLFQAYEWPGNVRELRNVLESAFNSISGPFIELDSLPDYLRRTGEPAGDPARPEGESLYEAVDRFEKSIILGKARQARTLTELADSLTISRQVLTYKIKKYGLKLFNV